MKKKQIQQIHRSNTSNRYKVKINQTDIDKEKHTHICIYTYNIKEVASLRARQIDPIDKQIDRQTDRQTDRLDR